MLNNQNNLKNNYNIIPFNSNNMQANQPQIIFLNTTNSKNSSVLNNQYLNNYNYMNQNQLLNNNFTDLNNPQLLQESVSTENTLFNPINSNNNKKNKHQQINNNNNSIINNTNQNPLNKPIELCDSASDDSTDLKNQQNYKNNKFLDNNILKINPIRNSWDMDKEKKLEYEDIHNQENSLDESHEFTNIRNFMQIFKIPKIVEHDQKKLSYLIRDYFKVKIAQVFPAFDNKNNYYIKIFFDIDIIKKFYLSVPLEFELKIGKYVLRMNKTGNYTNFHCHCVDIVEAYLK